MAETQAGLGSFSAERQKLLKMLLRERGVQAAPRTGIPRRPNPGPTAPVSFAQQRLWILDRLEPGNLAFNIPFVVGIAGRLDAIALLAAIREVERRHEALRTTFTEIGGEPMQVLHADPLGSRILVDLAALPEGRRETEAERLRLEQSARPFDLAAGPLVRTALLRLEEREHLFVLTFHHSVSDGWSGGVFVREMAVLYAALAQGTVPDPRVLPPLPIQYADFAEWQRRQLSGESLETQLRYWREHLADAPAALDLPADRPRPVEAAHRGGRRSFRLGPLLTAALRDFCRGEEATPFMVVLAAYAGLLSRVTGQEDLVIGSPIANRGREELEGLIGFFVNTLALRLRTGGDPTFRELAGRARSTAQGAYAHQDLPFERLVAELRPDRELGRNPLFEVVFALQNTPTPDVRVSGGEPLELRLLPTDTGSVQFDLALTLWNEQDDLRGDLEYSAELFDATTVERLGEHLRILLAGALADPGLRLSELPLLGDAERHQLTWEWNDTAGGYGPVRAVHELFAEQARRRPDAVAAVFETGEELTYGELDRRSSRLASSLRELGAGPEEVVGLWAERSPGLLAGMIAIPRVGGAYLPIDPAHPRERVVLQLREAGVRIAVMPDRAAAERLESWGLPLRVVCLEAEGEEIDRPRPEPAGSVDPDRLLYVMYTSGSTGRPKGVAVPHRGVVRLVRGRGHARLTPDEVLLQLAPASFDASTLEIWGALANGARLVMSAPGTLSLDDIAGLLARHRVTTLHLTAGLFHAMVDERLAALGGLRQLLTGGDALSAAHVRRTVAALPGCAVICCYGPTEGTTFTSCHAAHLATRDGGSVALIGRPIAGTQVHVVDRELRAVPIGVAGELCAGGEGLARGYLDQPDRTAERFVPDPFGGFGERLYRTGDRVRVLADGTLEFLGRFDDQVKVRGFRVEPGEVEAALETHPEVARTVVLVAGRGGEGARLAAFVVPRDGALPEIDSLRAHLRGRLPEFMVPAGFTVLPELPLTANAKVDRRALLALAETMAPAAGAEPMAPRTPVEERIAALWAEVLDREQVGVYDDFFALGGHSLLAVRLVSRLRDAFGLEMGLRTLFERPTVAGLAEIVSKAAADQDVLPPVVPVPRDRPFPQSYSQRRLWFIDQMEPGTALYSVPYDAQLTGSLDVAALAAALTAAVRRHEVLRTTYGAVDGEPVQIVHEEIAFHLPLVDVSALPEPVRQSEASRLTEEEAARPFDLSRGPVFRARLVRLRPDLHRFLTTTHHIACDAASLAVLWGEVAALYQAARSGRPAGLAPLPVQYADYAVWQRQAAGEGVLDAQLRYWKERLAGEPPVLEMPVDRPRPAVRTYEGAAQAVEIPAAFAGPLRALGQREGATPFMTFLAVYLAMLRRDSGQGDVSVGTPVSGRNRGELERVVGFFLNTLVLRIDLSGDPSFRQLLRRVRDLALEAFANADLPFDRLVDEIRPERSLSRSPLFQALFVLLHTGGTRAGSPPPADLRVDFLLPEETSAKFDLTLSLFAGDETERLDGAFEYATDLFDRTTMMRMAERFTLMAGAAADDADQPLSCLPVLSEAARHQIAREWNDTSTWLPQLAPGVHRLVERQVALKPEALAAVFEDRQVTYAELDRRASVLAWQLRELGVRPDVPVGILLERSLAMAVAVLGVLKSGGACLPIDPAYPPDRRAYIVENSRPAVLLVGEGYSGNEGVPLLALNLEGLSSLESLRSRQPFFADDLVEDNLSYIFYTSGSTGRPKGVAMAHRATRNLIEHHHLASETVHGRRATQFASLSFDVSFQEMLSCWASGGTLFVLSEDLRRDVPALADYLVEQRIEKAILPGVVLRAVAEEYQGRDLPPLADLATSGEALQITPALRDLLRRLPGCRLENQYGPTESHLATVHVLDSDPSVWAAHPHVGRPIENVTIHLLDPDLRPVPVGVIGELTIAGICLARGYLGRPDLTAERFQPDPMAAQPGGRLYRTGDRARYRADGNIEFLGRLDHQVKIRGFRVEPGEVEAVLGSHPAVRQALVIVREDRAGDPRLVAYLVPHAGDVVTPAELRLFLGDRLPAYMVPAHLVLLEAFPLTPNGKVDRRALPVPAEEGEDGRFVPPRTPVEEVLAAIWEEVLGRAAGARIGSNDDFFALGGHSLLATRVISRVREAFRVELPVRALFEQPTVAGLAQRIEDLQRSEDAPVAPPLVRARRDGAIPLSFAQQRLWFLDWLVPDSPLYNMPVAVRLAGRLDVAVLRAAFGEILRRHEALRTSFPAGNAGPVQAIAGSCAADLPLIDLGGLPAEERRGELRRVSAEEATQPFDLARGPVMRTRLVQLEPEEHALLVTLHHIVSDGWSLSLLQNELAALYGAFAAGRPSPLPELPVQYADFALWQREWLRGVSLESLLGYWRERLAGLSEVLPLPYDRQRPAVAAYRGRTLHLALPASLMRDLESLTRRQGATLSMTLMAGFQALLGRAAAHSDVAVGLVIANRTRREVEGLIGFFINTLVLRADLERAGTFAGLVAQQREVSLEAYAHQDLPFERLVEELQPKRDLGRNPLTQVMFAFQTFPRSEAETQGLRIIPPPDPAGDSGTAKFDLALSLSPAEGGLAGSLEYSSDLFDTTTVRRLADAYEVLLRAAVEEPGRPLSLLPRMSEAERHQLLREWNSTEADYPADFSLPELFAIQVRRNPGAPAVAYGDRSLTYGELDHLSESLARRLARLGVGPEVRVGLCAERSPELIVGMLGILKAGGAYVPLDPDHPRERLEFLLADARVSALAATRPAAESLPEHGLPMAFLDRSEGEEAELSPVHRPDGSTLAYVIHTSGSTGRPKGVEVLHRGVARLVINNDFLPWGPADRIGQIATPTFDAATWEIWGALLNGACVVGIPKEVALEPAALASALRDSQVTTIFLTTALFHQVARELPSAFSSLRALYVGGEAGDPGLFREVLRNGGPERLLGVYGPTEVTSMSTWYPIPGEEALRAGEAVPIGRPISNTTAYVLDPLFQPVPAGTAGELCLGGDGLARGYGGRPELTAEKWIPFPLPGDPGGRLYRTGDRVRLRGDGVLEFLGRIDHQIKIRGFRIEPGEIEARLCSHPGIGQAVVMAQEDRTGDRRLVAYVILREA